MSEVDLQEFIDTFYFSTGPCCAGCDWWRYRNSIAGECTKNAPRHSTGRGALFGITSLSLELGAGHVFTDRGYHCGDFADNFDWSKMPLSYLKRIGAKP